MLEVLLSVFVLSVGLMTIVAVISGSLRYSYETRDQIIATGLAQEGIELVRNVRDNNFAPIVAGGDGFASFSNNEHCRISVTTNLSCNNSREAVNKYYLQYVGGVYTDNDDTEGRFSRFIYIDYSAGGGDKRALVRSFVVWGDHTTQAGNGANRIPNNGHPASCQASPTCVYTETFLTAWK